MFSQLCCKSWTTPDPHWCTTGAQPEVPCHTIDGGLPKGAANVFLSYFLLNENEVHLATKQSAVSKS